MCHRVSSRQIVGFILVLASSHPHLLPSVKSNLPFGTAIFQVGIFGQPEPVPCGTSPTSIQNHPTGECSPFAGYYIQYFCDLSAGYQLYYSDSLCQNVLSVNQYPYQCMENSENGAYVQYSCANVELGPAVPFAWPLNNSVTTAYCISNVANAQCAGDAGSQCTQQAVIGHVCVPGDIEGSSVQTFCTEDGAYSGVAQYSDSACQNLLEVQLTSTQCVPDTNNAAVCTNVRPLNQPMPTVGYSTATNCTASGQIFLVSLFPANECVYGSNYSCPNGASSSQINIEYFQQDTPSECQIVSESFTESVNSCSDGGTFFCDGFNA